MTAPDVAALAAEADAAHTRLQTALTYYAHAAEAHLTASSALAAALIETQGDKA